MSRCSSAITGSYINVQFPENRLRAMVKRGAVPIGFQCHTGNADVIEISGIAGFDFVMLDTEHSTLNARALDDLIRISERAHLTPLVRVPDRHAATDMRRALEAGAQGLLIPQVRSAADIRYVLDVAMFPPQGQRGMCPATRAAHFSLRSWDDYAAWNNSEILLIPIIEHPEAVENVDAICASDSIHMIAFGAGDLSCAMGLGTQMMAHESIRAAYRRVLEAAKRHHVAVIGGPFLDPTATACRKALEEGASVLFLGLDLFVFRQFCERAVRELHDAVKETPFSRPEPAPSGFLS